MVLKFKCFSRDLISISNIRPSFILMLPLIILSLSLIQIGSIEVINWKLLQTPPYFTHEVNPRIMYFSLDYSKNNGHNNGNLFREKTLRCAAVGNPPPKYIWLKNNVKYPHDMFRDRVSISSSNGTLTFSHFVEEDQGFYQCLAENSNGTAFSERITIQQAWLQSFEPYEPNMVSVELGDPYSRNCTPPESNPPAHIFWIYRSNRDEQLLLPIKKSHISSNEQGTIFFHNVQEGDFKEDRFYACVAYNIELKEYKFSNQFNFDIQRNKRHKLEVNTLIPAAEQYVNQSSPIALVGQIHKLHCFFSGHKAPHPTWYHNGVEISGNNTKGFKFDNFGKTLVFNVTMDHLGKYECKFQTQSSAVDRVFNVKVDAAPYWHDSPPPNTNTSEGEDVVFDCKTSGNPTPIITFYKNGVEMKKPRHGENWVIEGSRLTIYGVKKGLNGQGDNAVYQCKSENKHGYLWTNFYLNLLAFQPKLLEEPGINEAIEGKPFTMSCKFFASPLANVTWTSPLLTGVEHRSNVDQFGVGWLIFEEVKSSYEGEYICNGTNKYGSAHGVVKLLVRKPTRLESFSESKMERQAGLPLKLPCQAEYDSNLDINYQWVVNGRPLEQKELDMEHYKILPDNSLLIEMPTHSDSGNYECVAKTKLDSASKNVFVSIEDVPVPIYSAYISRCDNEHNSATIQFEHLEVARSTVPVKEFWVRYIADPDEDSGRWKTHPVSIRAIDHEVVNDSERKVKASINIELHPFGTYVFEIIARNSIGDSAPQKVKGECVTEQKAPTRNPNGVRVEGTQPDNLIVYWDAMPREEWNGENFAYQIQYRPKGAAEWKLIKVEDPFSEHLTIDLGDRNPWEAYEVQVTAENKFGPSLVVPEIVEGRTGEGDPGITPKNFRVRNVTATSADFVWDPVQRSKVQGNFTGYKITYWFDDQDDSGTSLLNNAQLDQNIRQRKRRQNLKYNVRRESVSNSPLNRKTVIFSPYTSSGTISGLKPNSLNYATISVLNGQNEGAPSEVITFRTTEGVPTPVRGLNAWPMNNKDTAERGVVVVRWDLPRSPNGKLTHFGLVKCRTTELNKEQLNCEEESKIPIGVTEVRLKDLDFDSSYRFKVHAYTNAGRGPPNSADVKTLPEALRLNVEPSRPDLLKEKIGDDFLDVVFVPGKFDPETQAPVGNEFYVKYKEAEETDWKIKKPTNESLTAHVDGLLSGTKYDVVVVSVQRDNEGVVRETESRVHQIITTGVSPRNAQIYWILLILLAILLLLFFLCILYLCARQRGQKYPVAEKERLHGREPILAKDRAFDEYGKIDDDEKKSLTGHSRAGESETDSMAEFGEGDAGRFTEDGSFIGQYGFNKTLVIANSDRQQ